MERDITSEKEPYVALDKPGDRTLCVKKPELLKVMHYCSYCIKPELPYTERISD